MRVSVIIPTYNEQENIREILAQIAHKPVQKRFDQAIQMTEAFLMKVSTHAGWSEIVEKGREHAARQLEVSAADLDLLRRSRAPGLGGAS